MSLIAVAWLFHVVELDEANWACRHGLEELDRHATSGEAIEHSSTLAAQSLPAAIIVHRRGELPERIEVAPERHPPR